LGGDVAFRHRAALIYSWGNWHVKGLEGVIHIRVVQMF